ISILINHLFLIYMSILPREGLIRSLKIPQGRPKAKALGYQPRSLWATCGVAEATPFRNRDLIRGSLERFSSRWSPGDSSKTQIPFGNDKQKAPRSPVVILMRLSLRLPIGKSPMRIGD